MAEIKSTLDLVMEKTKHLKMSETEKKALDLEETLKKVPGLVQKYISGALKDRDFREEVKKYVEIDPVAVKKEIVKELARALTFKEKEEDLRVVDALKLLNLDDDDDILHKLKECLESFHTEQRELLEQKSKAYLKELENMGIRGSAVIPKVMLRQEEMSKLQALKATCLNLMNRLI